MRTGKHHLTRFIAVLLAGLAIGAGLERLMRALVATKTAGE